jgi:hypothetical protein
MFFQKLRANVLSHNVARNSYIADVAGWNLRIRGRLPNADEPGRCTKVRGFARTVVENGQGKRRNPDFAMINGGSQIAGLGKWTGLE